MSWTRQLLKIYYISFQKNLLQANETGGGYQTELEGVKRCFGFLQRLGVKIGVFISDRHRGIAKWIRENCPGTTHFSDIWHVARSVTKKLLAASKEKEFVDTFIGVLHLPNLVLSASSWLSGIHSCDMLQINILTTLTHSTRSAIMETFHLESGSRMVLLPITNLKAFSQAKNC